MNVTLSLPSQLVEMAKKHARETGASLSGLVRVRLENLLENESKTPRIGRWKNDKTK